METYTAWEWIRRRTLGTIGIPFEALASAIPIKEAATNPYLAGIKGGATLVASLFPPLPYFRQLEGINQSRARVWDNFDVIRLIAIAAETPGRILAGHQDVDTGVPGLGGVVVMPAFFGQDP